MQQLGVVFAHSPSRISLPRKGCRVGLRIVLFEACSAFTHVAACTLARSPIRDPLIEGFSHFVTSMTAPIASGWSGCRVGLAPTGKRRLVTAHTQPGHYPSGTPAMRKPSADALALGEVGWVIALWVEAVSTNGEGRIERKSSFGGGPRLFTRAEQR